MSDGCIKELPPIEVIDQIPSTNAEMKARGRAGAPHGSALRARLQTAGRGQRAHTWASPEGGLYLSVLIRPHVPQDALPALPVACALGVLGALREAGCPRTRLKWPNDIVVGHRKMAGILTELSTSRDGAYAVCGVGLNMEAPTVPAREHGMQALAPMGLLDALSVTAHVPTLDELAELIRTKMLEAVDWWMDAYGQSGAYLGLPKPGTRVYGPDTAHWIDDPVRGGAEGPLAPLLAPYNASLAFVGEQVRVFDLDGDERSQGTFLGVDGYGHALIAHQDGTVGTYDAASASIRPVRMLAR